MTLILRLVICVAVPNLLLWLVYGRTREWKILWGLVKKILNRISGKIRHK